VDVEDDVEVDVVRLLVVEAATVVVVRVEDEVEVLCPGWLKLVALVVVDVEVVGSDVGGAVVVLMFVETVLEVVLAEVVVDDVVATVEVTFELLVEVLLDVEVVLLLVEVLLDVEVVDVLVELVLDVEVLDELVEVELDVEEVLLEVEVVVVGTTRCPHSENSDVPSVPVAVAVITQPLGTGELRGQKMSA